MKKVFNYFLQHYDEEPLSVYKKTSVLIKSSITCVLVLLLIFMIHFLSGGHWLLISSDVLFVMLMLGQLFLIRKRRFEAAANLIIISVCVVIILQNPVTDYILPSVHTYKRCLETGMLFMAAIVLVALFAYEKYQLVMLVGTGIATLICHYFILIHKFYQGQHSVDSINFIVTYSFVMLLAGILSRFMMNMYTDLLGIVESEAQKVKLYNQNLELKVAERTHELEVQNDELKKVNSELDSFVYSVSHDLRAPLLSSLGLISISKLETDESKKAHYLELMNTSMLKLDGFIQDIINLSKNTRLEIEKDIIDFEQMIVHVLQEHAYMENADKIEMITEVIQLHPFISDYKRLLIVLNNIVSNAIRYSKPHHPNPYIKICIEIKPEKAIIEITDNGQGIGEEHISKVFDMFYRATTHKAGSGLGLYIVKETIQKLNGSISLTSQLGSGTTFIIEIPAIR